MKHPKRTANPAAIHSVIDFTVVKIGCGAFGVAATRHGTIALFPVKSTGRLTPPAVARFPLIARRADDASQIIVHAGGRRLPPRLAEAVAALRAYDKGTPPAHPVRLDLAGTSFQHAVWRRLLTIPAGSVTTYSTLARSIGRPNGARAVGAAVGRNPVTILIPCHRVVGANGRLTGYAWGLAMKRALLAHEGVSLRG